MRSPGRVPAESKRGDGDDELRGGDAVQGDHCRPRRDVGRSTRSARRGRGHRRAGSACRAPGTSPTAEAPRDGAPRRTCITSSTPRSGRGLGDAGDAVGRQPATAPRRARSRGAARRPTSSGRRCAAGRRGGRAARPLASPAEFSVHRMPLRCCTRTGVGGRHLVEHRAIQRCPRRLRGNPTARIQPSSPTAASAAARARSSRPCTSRGPTRTDVSGRGRGVQVDVVVVQAGDDGAARARRTPPRPHAASSRCGHLDDSLLGTDVDHGAVEQACTLNQHGSSLRSATSRSTMGVVGTELARRTWRRRRRGNGVAARSLSVGRCGQAPRNRAATAAMRDVDRVRRRRGPATRRPRAPPPGP